MSDTVSQTSKNAQHSGAARIALVGLMAAVICILSPWTIPLPVSPVPLSLATLAIYFTVYVLGAKLGTLSTLIYILLGFVGLPVFSGFSAGPAKLLGPTGGYIIGYLFMALICGFFIDRFLNKIYMCFFGMVLGTAVLYAFGTAWLMYQGHLSLTAALTAAVIPFLPGDLVKIIIVMLLGPVIRKRLIQAGLFLS